MPIYLISRKESARYDECRAVVVRAKDEAEARIMAASCRGDEPEYIWKMKKYSICKKLEQDGKSQIICRDFYEA